MWFIAEGGERNNDIVDYIMCSWRMREFGSGAIESEIYVDVYGFRNQNVDVYRLCHVWVSEIGCCL